MARKLSSDRTLFLAVMILVMGGLVMVFSSSALTAVEHYKNPYYFLIKQGIWAGLGFLVLGCMLFVPYSLFRKPAVVYILLVLALALLTAALFLPEVNRTHRWIRLFGFSLQPSEIAKFALMFFLAYQLDKKRDRLNDIKWTILPCTIITGAFFVLTYLEPDFGAAVTMAFIAGIMLYLGGVRLRYLFAGVLATVPAAALLLLRAGYRKERLLAFLDPAQDPMGSGFQILQSLIAVGKGGIFGSGLGESTQKLYYLPYSYTDFIYAVVGEELGLIGCLTVLALFLVIMWRGMLAAVNAPDYHGGLIAAGITALIVSQGLINISVVLGLLPTKGIPLPFFSFGGSSLLANMFGIGVLLNVSQHSA